MGGSNSVNVFLGLGLPWMIGAIKWVAEGPTSEWDRRYRNKEWAKAMAKSSEDAFLVVEAGNLAFSVLIFSTCAVACIVTLYVRRRLCGGELGGPRLAKIVTSGYLVVLWLLYVLLSSWYTMKNRV